MFERLKKVFAGRGVEAVPQDPPLSQWAAEKGFSVVRKGRTEEFSMTGQLAGRPFRMDRTPPTRSYIADQELRARVELGTDSGLAVMLITRSLRDALEAKAFENVTDSLQTAIDTRLPEEARWLAMYDEVGWETGAVPAFWRGYSIVADTRAQAQGWVGAALMQAMLAWPDAHAHLPRILMLQRGRLYLRMEFTPASLPTLQHAVQVLEMATRSLRRADT